MDTVRINLANHFDLYKDETWDQVYTLYDNQKPQVIWVSPKCTFFCDWVDLNYKARPEVLQKYLRRERRMLRQLTKFLHYAASQILTSTGNGPDDAEDGVNPSWRTSSWRWTSWWASGGAAWMDAGMA